MASKVLTSIVLVLICGLRLSGAVIQIESANPEVGVNPSTIWFPEHITESVPVKLVKIISDTGGAIEYEQSIPDLNFAVREESGEYFLFAERIIDREGGLWTPEQQEFETACYTNLYLKEDGTTVQTPIQVEIRDSNDNNPTFTQVCSLGQVKENDQSAILCTNPSFKFEDKDRFLDKAISMTIERDPQGIFKIEQNGTITLNQPCDYEAAVLHIFDVVVTDTAGQKATAQITVQVEDESDQPPIWLQANSFSILETAGSSSVATVRAVDGDFGINTKILYSMTVSPPLFRIDETTGEIFIDGDIDASEVALVAPTLVLSATLKATEDPSVGSGESTDRIIYITIEDTNDKVVEIVEPAEEIVSHPETTNAVINDVCTVEDRDPTPDFSRYKISIEKPSDSWFVGSVGVSPDIGVGKTSISLTLRDIDYENPLWQSNISVSIKIEPTDLSGDTDAVFCDFDLAILDANDNAPKWVETSLTIPVLENFVGTLESKLEATDDDTNEEFGQASLAFSLQDNSITGLTIDEDGSITINDADLLDYESSRTFSVNVKVTDNKQSTGGNQNSVSGVLTFVIQDANDNPPTFLEPEDYFLGLYILETRPDQAANESDVYLNIASIQVTDPDTESRFCFELVPSPDSLSDVDLVEFSEPNCDVNSISGRTTLKRKRGSLIDREDPTVVDNYGFLNYTLIVYDHYNDTITRNSDTIEVRIQVLDRNDNSPEFGESKYTLKVYENHQQSCTTQQLGTLTANDLDECSTESNFGCVVFMIETKNNDGWQYFEVEMDSTSYGSGTVTTSSECGLDAETKRLYNLTIYAVDDYIDNLPLDRQKGLKTPTYVEIEILDINDNSPDFNPDGSGFTASVFENVTGEVQVGAEISVSDKDIDADNGSVGVVEIVTVRHLRDSMVVEEWNEYFPFTLAVQDDGRNKKISFFTNTSFNFEFGYGQYVIIVNASDQAASEQLQSQQEFNILVLDINNNYPIWTEDLKKLNGSSILVKPGSSNSALEPYNSNGNVPVFSATDADDPDTDNARVQYRVVGTGNSIGIRADTGELFWSTDNPAQQNELCVEAYDGGINELTSDPLCVLIRIVYDVQTPPTFDRTDFSTSVDENSEGAVKQSIPSATDKNDDVIYYHIIGLGSEPSDLFRVDDMGQLYVKKSGGLDREANKTHDPLVYQVLIYATDDPNDKPDPITDLDSLGGRRNQSLLVQVTVDDVIDYKPEFKKSIITGGASFSYTENQDIVIFSSGLVADDWDLNDPITYTISEITASDPSLEEIADPPLKLVQDRNDLGANITLNFSPLSVMKGYFSFTVTATDKSSASASVDCRVYMANEEHFTQLVFSNNYTEVVSKREKIIDIVSTAIGRTCNIDSIDQTAGQIARADGDIETTVVAHFIDTESAEPVSNTEIDQWKLSNPRNYGDLQANLQKEGLYLEGLGNQAEPPEGTSSTTIGLFVVAAVSAILVIAIVILLAFFVYRTRSMRRTIQAYEAESAAQKAASAPEKEHEALPNTNKHAVNPIWSEDSESQHIPQFDTASMASRGSSLVGIEDQEDFRDHEERSNPAFEDEFSSSSDEGPEANAYGSARNPAYSVSDRLEDEAHNSTTSLENPGNSDDVSDAPLYATVSRKNPLANIGSD